MIFNKHVFTLAVLVSCLSPLYGMDVESNPDLTNEQKAFLLSSIVIPQIKFEEYKRIGYAKFSFDAAKLRDLNNTSNALDDFFSLSPDGNQLASASIGNNEIKLWDVQMGTCIKTFNGHANWVYSVAFSSNGKQLASGSRDKTVKLWDVKTGTCINTYSGHSDSVDCVAFNPDANQLASGSADETIKLWDLNTGACINTFNGHANPLCSVAFSSDGKQLASVSRNTIIKLWDLQKSTCIRTINDNYINGDFVIIGFLHPDDNYLGCMSECMSEDECVQVWNMQHFNNFRTKLQNNSFTFKELALFVKYASKQGLTESQKDKLVTMGFNIQ